MKLSTIKRVLTESFPSDVQKWIGSLVSPLNNFLDQVTRALTNELTLADNLKAQSWVVTLEAAQTYPIKLAYNLNQKPSVLIVGRIASQDSSAIPAHSFTWTWYGDRVEVTFGSLSAVKYDVNITAQV